MIVGSTIWLAACRIEWFYTSAQARIVLFSVLVPAYLVAGCVTLGRMRETLPSKTPLIFVLGLHAAVYFARAPGVLLVPPPLSSNVVVTPWFIVIAVESLFHLVASNMLLVTMSKERSENRRATAGLDGLADRHAQPAVLHGAGGGATGAACAGRRSACLLMIDIDHFKAINDKRGHQAGDEILQAVAVSLAERLRPSDLCGRVRRRGIRMRPLRLRRAQGRS